MGSLSFSFSIRLELTRKFNRIARRKGREVSILSIGSRACSSSALVHGIEYPEGGRDGERGVCEECNYSRENDERHLLY